MSGFMASFGAVAVNAGLNYLLIFGKSLRKESKVVQTKKQY